MALKKVGIIVLNWNGKEDTVKCLESLQKIPHVQIILVDNGSTDGSQSHFKTHFPECTLIETGENLGYAGGNNVGIEYGLKQGLEFFLILNNDTIVDPDIVHAFLEEFKEYPNAGILGGKIYLMSEPKRLDHLGGRWNSKDLKFDYVGYRELDDRKLWDDPLELDYVCGAAIMVRREVFEKIGLFESQFFLFWEETDFCFRAKRAGFSVMSCPKALVWHKVSASFTGGKPHAAYFFWRNRLFWIERNFSGARRMLYLSKLIGGSLCFFYTARLLRQTQRLVQRAQGSSTTRNTERIIRYNAALFGTKDYLMRRFGPGRSKKFMNCH